MPKELDLMAIDEVRAAVTGLKGQPLTERIAQLATHYGVSVSSIYRVTQATRAPRKPRADKGKRKADLLRHPGLSLAAQLVTTKNFDPDIALETARANGHETPVSLESFQRYLREHNVNKKARKTTVRAHRRWEADAPCDIFQFDISGVKERWFDLTTRRLLYVSDADVNDNHPNRKPNRVRVWKFTLIDDFSRRRFVRFYAIDKPTSIEVIDYLLQAFRAFSVPKVLYTDNDVIIISKRMKRAADILDKAFAESGGFKLQQHAPHNAQATGKVERSHQLIEKFEKLIGALSTTPTIEALNDFADQINTKLDWQRHRTTGEVPMIRWRSNTTALRVPPSAVLDAAFKAEEFTRKLSADLTLSYNGAVYQLPRKTPFVDWIGETLTVVWPAGDADWFVVVGKAGVDYEISRTIAGVDAAGDYKTVPDSKRQTTLKTLRTQAKERLAEAKANGTELIVPGFDVAFESAAEQRPAMFPQATDVMTMERLDLAAPGAVQPSAQPSGRWLNYWQAVTFLVDEGAFDSESATFAADKLWLKTLFSTQEEIAENEIRAALAGRGAATVEIETEYEPNRVVLPFRKAA